jgi:hypothetical protein
VSTGSTTTYASARAEAERVISEARNSRDPLISAALLKQADIPGFEGLCRRDLEDPAPGRKGCALSEVARVGMTRIINKELIPAWGARNPNSIQPEEIEVSHGVWPAAPLRASASTRARTCAPVSFNAFFGRAAIR